MLLGRRREITLNRLLHRLAYGTAMQVQRRVASPSEKADSLLKSHLTAFQRYTYERYKFFYVKGSDGTIYGICDGVWVVPIHMNGDSPLMRGIHAKNVSALPHGDRLLGQKLIMETSARWANAIACASGTTLVIQKRMRPDRVLRELRREMDHSLAYKATYKEACSFFDGYAGPTSNAAPGFFTQAAIYYYDEQGRQCLG